MFRFSTFILLGLIAFCCQAASLSIGRVSIDNIGMNKRMIRLNDNGIILDNSGVCAEVNVGIRASGLSGQRVLCIVYPMSDDGYTLTDKMGDAMSTVAVTIPSASFDGTVMIPLPYQWIITEKARQQKKVDLGVVLACLSDDSVGEEKVVTLSESDIKIDNRQLGNKLMGDLMGTRSDMLGSMIGALFDTSDAESTVDCPSCDGTGICPHCDGDAFFDPSSCRKCANDPGICRRCKGEGTITIKYDIY